MVLHHEPNTPKESESKKDKNKHKKHVSNLHVVITPRDLVFELKKSETTIDHVLVFIKVIHKIIFLILIHCFEVI